MTKSARRAWLALWPIGIAVAVMGEVGPAVFGDVDRSPYFFALDFFVGFAYLVSGLLVWRRRPENAMGKLMVATGFVWFIGNYAVPEVPFLASFGNAFEGANLPLVMHIVLSYPNGRLADVVEQVVVALGYLAMIVAGSLIFLTAETPKSLFDDRAQMLAPLGNDDVANAALRALDVTYFVCGLAVVLLVARRLIRATPARRIALIDLWIASLAFGVAWAILSGRNAFELEFSQAVFDWSLIARLAIPVALAIGAFRLELSRAAVGGLVLDLDARDAPTDLRQSLARALRDPTLQVAYWMPERSTYADVDGREVELPRHADRAVTQIDREGRRLAALIHDPALLERPDLLKAAGAAAGLALENARLHAEILLQLEEVRASRARIIEAADAERIRIERDLHDGAQQRLLALSLALRDAHRKLGDDGEAAKASLDAALGELSSALSELRELARGVYPAILTEDGLGAALESLAMRAVVPTSVQLDIPQRPSEAVERTAYFLVSEALANVAKHARATSVLVTASILSETLFVEVRDDGVGGADPTLGSGLRGLTDRVAAAGGRLRIESLKDAGTRLVAEIPCG